LREQPGAIQAPNEVVGWRRLLQTVALVAGRDDVPVRVVPAIDGWHDVVESRGLRTHSPRTVEALPLLSRQDCGEVATVREEVDRFDVEWFCNVNRLADRIDFFRKKQPDEMPALSSVLDANASLRGHASNRVPDLVLAHPDRPRRWREGKLDGRRPACARKAKQVVVDAPFPDVEVELLEKSVLYFNEEPDRDARTIVGHALDRTTGGRLRWDDLR
jgi:hypothetical protein